MKRFKNNRRKNYYIKKRFQRNFILKFCTLVVIGSLISGAIIYGMSRATVTTTFENSRLTIKSTADYILPSVLLSGAIVIVVLGLAAIAITLFTSHRIAGPLYRIEKDVDKVASGNLNTKFDLRAGDEIKPLALGLDKMTQAIRARIAKIKSIVDELDGADQVGQDAKNKVKKLKDEIKKFET